MASEEHGRGSGGGRAGAKTAIPVTLSRAFYSLANVLLHLAHLALIVLVLAGWWFCQTRLVSVLLMTATLVSWYGLKPLMAKDGDYGYCLITDIQWRLRRRIGLAAPEGGYIKFLAERFVDHELDDDLVEKVTLAAFFACVVAAAVTSLAFGWC